MSLASPWHYSPGPLTAQLNYFADRRTTPHEYAEILSNAALLIVISKHSQDVRVTASPATNTR